jgi:AsmA protein
MRRNTVIARIRKPLLAISALLVFSVLAPMFFAERHAEERSAFSVTASPRDQLYLTVPVKLADAPDLTLVRGLLSEYGPAGADKTMSHLLLEGPAFVLNAGVLRTAAKARQGGPDGSEDLAAPSHLVRKLVAPSFEGVTIRRGTLDIAMGEGLVETIGDIEAEVTRTEGRIESKGSFTIRGQRVTFVAKLGQPLDKKAPLRRSLQAELEGSLIHVVFDGHLDLAPDLLLTGKTDLSTPSLRRIGRWFGIPLQTTDGFNAATVKADLTWARRVLAFEKAQLTVDGNKADGRVALNLAGERPLIDATLDFARLDLTPHVEATRLQLFGFDLPGASWPSFDISLPMIRHLDADLRISARKVALKGHTFGQGAATITAHGGKLQADITELELGSGTLSAQISAGMNEIVPRYGLRAKIEGIEAGPVSAQLLGAPVLTGRATVTVDLRSTGYSLHEIVRRLSGKAALTLPDGGRLALDAEALREAVQKGTHGWFELARSPARVDKLEAQALLIEGVAFAEVTEARSGSRTLTASGRLGLDDGNLDLRLTWRSEPPAGQPPKPGDADATVSLRGPWYDPVARVD